MSQKIKIKGEKERQNKKTKKKRGDGSFGESVKAKWICCVFKLGFIQLMCKALIFKSNLELALSIIKKRKLYESKHAVVECQCLQIWDLLSFLICSSILL